LSLWAVVLGILEGARMTLLVTAYAMLYAVPFAFILGIAQYLLPGRKRILATVIIEFWRSNAVIILLFFFYYVLPFAGLRWTSLNVAAMVLGLNIGAYGTQVVRGALAAIDRGQIEAGKSLGLSRMRILFLIELPQALKPMMPSFTNEVIQLIQGTSLVSLVALTDMTFRAKEIGQLTYQPAEIYTALLLSYFIISYPFALLGKRLEAMIPSGRSLGREV
jgi:polar amino acid transport system permease protein